MYIKKGLKARGIIKIVQDITSVIVKGIEIYNIYILIKENVHRAIVKAVCNILRTKNIIIIGDFNYTFKQNSKRKARPRLDNQTKEIQLLNDLEIPTKRARTLDFIFNNNKQAKASVNKIYSRLDYQVLQVQIKTKKKDKRDREKSKKKKIKPKFTLKKKVNIVLYKKLWK